MIRVSITLTLGVVGVQGVIGGGVDLDRVEREFEGSVSRGLSHSLQRIPPPWTLREAWSDSSSLSVSPLVLSASGDRLTVRVERDEAGRGDFLAAYTPALQNVSKSAPARVVNLSSISEYVERGSATVEMYLTNMRASYDVVLFDGDSTAAVARSAAVSFADYDEPRAPRALPGRLGGWSLAWTSLGNDDDEEYFCVVDGETLPATSSRLSSTAMCGAPADGFGFNCRAPSTHVVRAASCAGTIEYRCGSSGQLTAPAQLQCEPSRDPTTLVVFGDLGRGERPDDDSETVDEYGSPAADTIRLLANETAVDLVYHIGDISYAVGYLSVWDDYLEMMAPVLRRFPYALNLGNHELDYPVFPEGRTPSYYTGYDSGGECGVSTQFHLPMPADLDAPWWSRDVGLAHVVAMCTECDYRRGSPQHAWIANDLAGVDRARTPWIVFGGHRPGYVDSTFSDPSDNGAGDLENMELFIEELEPLLLEYKVDIAFFGHNHAYQRLCACEAGGCASASTDGLFSDPAAPVYVVVGTGGAAFTKNAFGAPFAERVFYSWGYAKLILHNATYLEWSFVDNGRRATAGAVLDTFSIVKEAPLPQEQSSRGVVFDSHNGDIVVAYVVLAILVLLCVGCRCLGQWVARRAAPTSMYASVALSEKTPAF